MCVGVTASAATAERVPCGLALTKPALQFCAMNDGASLCLAQPRFHITNQTTEQTHTRKKKNEMTF